MVDGTLRYGQESLAGGDAAVLCDMHDSCGCAGDGTTGDEGIRSVATDTLSQVDVNCEDTLLPVKAVDVIHGASDDATLIWPLTPLLLTVHTAELVTNLGGLLNAALNGCVGGATITDTVFLSDDDCENTFAS